jgi:DNA repair exonuclease SbcCD ATPase subunit|tara:strand:+ start:2878 stop:4653 length:1776 start_codon:yes stop_codon:yes gene_type:complete
MINIRNVTIKNFMSVGNVTQAVRFDDAGLTLVLGNNVDLGGDGSRNGTGKTTIINALSYALYGNALTNIRKDNLINKTNNKGMLVTVDFDVDGTEYRIERGRKPNIFKFVVNNHEFHDDATDEIQGEGRLSQQEIEKLLGMSHDMFKHIVCLNTYTEPFLSMRPNDQRAIIEQLLGITMLSEKASVLKDLMKETKDSIKEEEYRIKGIEEANTTIAKSIKDLERRRRIWEEKKVTDTSAFGYAIAELEHLDIEAELKLHTGLVTYNNKVSQQTQLNAWISNIEADNNKQGKLVEKLGKEIGLLEDHKCYACGQDMHDTKQEEILKSKQEQRSEASMQILANGSQFDEHTSALDALGEIGAAPDTFYDDVADAHDHRNKVVQLQGQLELKIAETDPYTDQIEVLNNEGIREVSWNSINDLNVLRDHQDFLMKLLTNKDSFIRKRIIEQNLSYLNTRLGYYLTKLGLPHEVQFQPDLTVEITELGRELDFDNLSRGERNRLILGLSFAFRDVFESMNTPINFMAIDELVDSGMDSNGVEASLSVLKKIVRERNKNVFLISHRDELVGRVSHTLQVLKENGFTTFNADTDYVEE